MTPMTDEAPAVPIVDGSGSACDNPEILRALQEYRIAREAGAKPDRGEFLSRHATVCAELVPCLDALDFVYDAAPQVQRSIADSNAAVVLESLSETAPLGDFRILREIGRGGMGMVYEAEQMSLSRRVALKVLPFAGAMDGRQLQRFKIEAQAAAQLHHTNIVPVHFVGCERGVHFYAMQLIEGHSLAEMIAELRGQADGAATRPRPPSSPLTDATVDAPAGQAIEPPSGAAAAATTSPIAALSTIRSTKDKAYFRTVAQLGIQSAEALDYAHQQGIVHRDVKPANLLVDADARLWVTDFGLAQIQGDARMTMTGDLVGTLRYMSPEQALAKRVIVDHRSDIYSLGATLYELLTLEPAFGGNDRQEVLRQIAFEEPLPPRRRNKSIPAELETIVLKALEKNPADRYSTSQELAEDLQRYVRDEPIRARRPTVVQRARKWARRHKPVVWSAVIATTVLIAVVATGIGWFLGDRAAQRRELDRVVEEALDESVARQREEKRSEALSAARRAVELSESGNASEAVRRRAKARVADLELVENLENIRFALIEEGIQGADRLQGGERYAQVFRAFGLDIEALPPELAAEGMRSTTVCSELTIALLYWAKIRRLYAPNDVETNWRHLIQVARLADPNNESLRITELLERGQGALIEHAATELAAAEAGRLTPAVLIILDHVVITPGAWKPLETLLRRIQARHPGDFWLNVYLAFQTRLRSPPKPDESLRYFSMALAIRPDNPAAHCYVGTRLITLGRPEEAIAACRAALSLQPKLALAHNTLGEALAAKGSPDEAIAAWRRAIACDPKYVHAHYNLGNALAAKGCRDQAIACYKEALRLFPDEHRVMNNWARLLATCQDPKLCDPVRAVALGKRAVELAAHEGRSWHTLGVAHYRNADWKASIEALSKSDELYKGGMLAFNAFFLAMAHWQLGDKDKARDWYAKAVAWVDKNQLTDEELKRFRAEAAELLGSPDDELKRFRAEASDLLGIKNTPPAKEKPAAKP